MDDFIKQYITGLAEYEAYNKPDVIINHIPLYNVQYLEIALSQDDLKFRAEGYTYIGNQEGANSGIRISCILDGPLQDVILNAIEYTFLWCKGGDEVRNVNYHIDKKVNHFTNYTNIMFTKSYLISPSTKFVGFLNDRAVRNIRPTEYIDSTVETINTSDPDALRGTTKYGKLKKSNEYKHRNTFMMMTSDNVIYKLFIQTYIYRKSVINGNNVTILHLFLRRYDPITDIDLEIEDNTYYNGGFLSFDFEVDIESFVADTKVNKTPTNTFNTITTDDEKYLSKLASNKQNVYRFGTATRNVDQYQNVTYDITYYDKLVEKARVNPDFDDETNINRVDRKIVGYREYKRKDTTDIEYKIKIMHRFMMMMKKIVINNKSHYALSLDRTSPMNMLTRIFSPQPALINEMKVIM